MTKKDYVLVAKVLATIRGEAVYNAASRETFIAIERTAELFADALEATEPKFQRSKFLRATRQF